MSRIRQDIQTRKSDLYDDTLTPGSTLESGSTSVESDLNALRSQAKLGLHGSDSGNWYDNLPLVGGRRPGLVELNVELLLDSDPPAVGNTNTITRLSGKTVNETWINNITLNKIKTADYTRTADKLTTEVVKVYAADGTTIAAQKTVTYARVADKVTTITTTRDI